MGQTGGSQTLAQRRGASINGKNTEKKTNGEAEDEPSVQAGETGMGESVALNPIRYLSVTTMEKRRQNLKEKLKMYQSVARWERSQTLNPIINLLKKTWKRGYDLES